MKPLRATPRAWRCCVCMLLLLLLALLCAPALLHAQQFADDADIIDPLAAASTAVPSSPAPSRTLLFRPAFDPPLPLQSASNSPTVAPFPSSATRALESPFPLHVSLDALAPPARFRFGLLPSLPVGATLVGFDWRRNGTVGSLRRPTSGGAGGASMGPYGVEWGATMPPWIKVIDPGATLGESSAGTGTGADTGASDANTLTLQLTAPQSGDRTTVYSAPPPVLLHFVALVQYVCAPPIRPDDPDDTTAGTADSISSPPSADMTDSDAPINEASSDSGASSFSSSSTNPLVLVAEVQWLSLLVSLSITPPFAQRVSELAPYFALSATPNLMSPRNRVSNKRGSALAQSGGLGSAKWDWRDEVVFGCAMAQGKECAICTPPSPSSSSDGLAPPNPLSSHAAFPGLCAFPAGSFFSVSDGTLRVLAPLALLGSVQVNRGATLEFDHDTPLAAAAAGTSASDGAQAGPGAPFVNAVSVIDCRDQLGVPSPLVNEGTIVVRRGSV